MVTNLYALKKIRDLCSKFPKTTKHQSSLDDVAAHVYRPYLNAPYVNSTLPPESRYNLEIDSSAYHNTMVPDFFQYGPNEQYLINKVFYSPSYLMFVIGGIGVGKTRFTDFLMNKVLPSIDKTLFPYLVIYYDFLNDSEHLTNEDDSITVKDAFSRTFCDYVEAKLSLASFFDLETEVSDIWDDLIKLYRNKNRIPKSLSFIIKEMYSQNATHKHLAQEYEKTIEIRYTIKRTIAESPTLRSDYIPMLLNYTRKKFLNKNPAGLLIIVDNVDKETSLVQQTIGSWIKPFARQSGCRVVVNARQTTYYQQYDDGVSDPIDKTPYCGATPFEVINARTNDFISNHEKFKEFYNPEMLPDLVQNVKFIQEHFFQQNIFQILFHSLSGRSVRKGLLIAQNIIFNSVYDTGALSPQINTGDILRALLIGPNASFKSFPKNIVENLFETEAYPEKSYLLKIRILRLLRGSKNGVSIGSLTSTLSGFKYELPMICDALNSLKSLDKRLIWSDSVRLDFDGEKELVKQNRSRLYISTAGEGYIDHLVFEIAYIQEVMLDTKVKRHIFGSEWDYGKLEDRFNLVMKFLVTLSKQDMKEVDNFLDLQDINDYMSICPNIELITKRMLKKVWNSMDRILSSILKNQYNEKIAILKNELKEIYEDRIILMENFEEKNLSIE